MAVGMDDFEFEALDEGDRALIEMLRPLVGDETARRMWAAAHRPPPEGAPRPTLKGLCEEAIRAWLRLHCRRRNRTHTLETVIEVIDLVEALRTLTDERFIWLGSNLREAVETLRSPDEARRPSDEDEP